MTVRAVEWKQPYTWGTAIEIDENKVISLRLRDENNLIIYDAGDNEIYVDLQLPDELTPTDAFPVWITTGRVIVDNGWDLQWTLICAKTTSGDNIKLLYADEWTLWIDNWTWTFKQIYFKSDVDWIITTLTTYINTELAKKQNWVTSATAPTDPEEWDLWYDTTNSVLKVYDWTQWNTTWWWGWGTWDVQVSTQANNIFTSWMKIWWGTRSNYESLTPDSNTAYLLVADSPTPWGWQPWANTVAYYPLTSISTVDDESGNNRDLTNSWIIFGDYWWVDCGYFDGSVYASFSWFSLDNSARTVNFWAYCTWSVWGYYAVAHISDFSYSPSWSLWVKFNNWNTNVWPWDWVNASAETVTATVTAWWHNVLVTQESTTVKLYVDGTLIGTNSSYPSESWTPSGWSVGSKNASTHSEKFIGYVSNLILEDKVWTATEVSDYYDLTKWDYWIS